MAKCKPRDVIRVIMLSFDVSVHNGLFTGFPQAEETAIAW